MASHDIVDTKTCPDIAEAPKVQYSQGRSLAKTLVHAVTIGFAATRRAVLLRRVAACAFVWPSSRGFAKPSPPATLPSHLWCWKLSTMSWLMSLGAKTHHPVQPKRMHPPKTGGETRVVTIAGHNEFYKPTSWKSDNLLIHSQKRSRYNDSAQTDVERAHCFCSARVLISVIFGGKNYEKAG